MNDFKRRPYLINKMLKAYLIASILSTAVMNLNVLIDSILMGQFLGSSALSAITLSNPIELMLNAFSLLISSGAAVLIGKAFGGHETEKIKQRFTVVIISVIVFGILSILSAFVLTNLLTDFVCIEDSLKNLTHDYVFTQLLIGGLLVGNSTLALLVDVAGRPQIATKAMILQCVVNIVCDTLYVRVLGGGIMFASLATGTGALFSILYMMKYLLSKDCPYRISLRGYKGMPFLGEHLVNGLSGMIIQVSMTLLTLLCNYFIQVSLGENGMFVQSIGFQAITIGFIVANGVGNGLMTLGSILSGENDLVGLNMLFRKCMRIVAVCTGIFMVALLFFAPQLAMLFGSDKPEQIVMAQEGLPFIVLSLPGINMAVMMSMTMLINGFVGMSQVISISIIASLGISFLIVNNLFTSFSIWIAYPLATIIILIAVLILTQIKRIGKRSEIQFLSLLPVCKERDDLLEMTLPCTDLSIKEGMEIVNSFLEKNGAEDKHNKITNAVSAYLEDVLTNGECTLKDYIDLRIMKSDNDIAVSIINTGKAFNPADSESGKQAIYNEADDMGYNYAFRQNKAVLRWNL